MCHLLRISTGKSARQCVNMRTRMHNESILIPWDTPHVMDWTLNAASRKYTTCRRSLRKPVNQRIMNCLTPVDNILMMSVVWRIKIEALVFCDDNNKHFCWFRFLYENKKNILYTFHGGRQWGTKWLTRLLCYHFAACPHSGQDRRMSTPYETFSQKAGSDRCGTKVVEGG